MQHSAVHRHLWCKVKSIVPWHSVYDVSPFFLCFKGALWIHSTAALKQVQHIIYKLVQTTERDGEHLFFLFFSLHDAICSNMSTTKSDSCKLPETVTWSTSKLKSWLCLTSCSLKAGLLISPPKNIFCQSRSVTPSQREHENHVHHANSNF